MTLHAPPGRAALVTGGGSGIGAAVARRLAADGVAVGLVGRRRAPLVAVADEIREAGGRALELEVDVGEPGAAERAVAAAVESFGSLDVLVSNAGRGRPGTALEQTPEGWDAVLRTNLTGAFLVCRAALPHLLARRGAIVVVASLSGLRAAGASVAYCASKAGLVMLTKCLALDHGPDGVRANCVCPGWVRTPMADGSMDEFAAVLGGDREDAYRNASAGSPLRRPAEAEEVAEAVRWLASPAASYVNGAVLTLDGGASAVDATYAAQRATSPE